VFSGQLIPECPICIAEFNTGDLCRQLPCDHVFHRTCIDQWLQVSIVCPMCKRNIQAFLHGEEAEYEAMLARSVSTNTSPATHTSNTTNENEPIGADEESQTNRTNNRISNPMIEMSAI
jgi:hypothetical protein